MSGALRQQLLDDYAAMHMQVGLFKLQETSHNTLCTTVWCNKLYVSMCERFWWYSGLLMTTPLPAHPPHPQGCVLPLPRSPTVAEICRRYLDHVRRERNAAADSAAGVPAGGAAATTGSADAEQEDFISGLSAYFDKSLAHCLLYPCERAQARRVLAGGALPSSLYGAEHLLRLFVKLPELLPQVREPKGLMPRKC